MSGTQNTNFNLSINVDSPPQQSWNVWKTTTPCNFTPAWSSFSQHKWQTEQFCGKIWRWRLFQHLKVWYRHCSASPRDSSGRKLLSHLDWRIKKLRQTWSSGKGQAMPLSDTIPRLRRDNLVLIISEEVPLSDALPEGRGVSAGECYRHGRSCWLFCRGLGSSRIPGGRGRGRICFYRSNNVGSCFWSLGAFGRCVSQRLLRVWVWTVALIVRQQRMQASVLNSLVFESLKGPPESRQISCPVSRKRGRFRRVWTLSLLSLCYRGSWQFRLGIASVNVLGCQRKVVWDLFPVRFARSLQERVDLKCLAYNVTVQRRRRVCRIVA